MPPTIKQALTGAVGVPLDCFSSSFVVDVSEVDISVLDDTNTVPLQLFSGAVFHQIGWLNQNKCYRHLFF